MDKHCKCRVNQARWRVITERTPDAAFAITIRPYSLSGPWRTSSGQGQRLCRPRVCLCVRSVPEQNTTAWRNTMTSPTRYFRNFHAVSRHTCKCSSIYAHKTCTSSSASVNQPRSAKPKFGRQPSAKNSYTKFHENQTVQTLHVGRGPTWRVSFNSRTPNGSEIKEKTL